MRRMTIPPCSPARCFARSEVVAYGAALPPHRRRGWMSTSARSTSPASPTTQCESL
jgi:hypothetical protein